jgi:hypothetical protein
MGSPSRRKRCHRCMQAESRAWQHQKPMNQASRPQNKQILSPTEPSPSHTWSLPYSISAFRVLCSQSRATGKLHTVWVLSHASALAGPWYASSLWGSSRNFGEKIRFQRRRRGLQFTRTAYITLLTSSAIPNWTPSFVTLEQARSKSEIVKRKWDITYSLLIAACRLHSTVILDAYPGMRTSLPLSPRPDSEPAIDFRGQIVCMYPASKVPGAAFTCRSLEVNAVRKIDRLYDVAVKNDNEIILSLQECDLLTSKVKLLI